MSSCSSLRRHVVVNERYEILRKIGQGSFGSVYMVKDLRGAQQQLAVKLEKKTAKRPMLQYEHRVYQALAGSDRFCRVHAYDTSGPQNLLAMELLGDSVDARFGKCGRKVRHTTAMWLMKQMLSCVEAMHAAFFLHRDIKPHNFAMSTRPPYVKVIDMGLAKQYRTRNLEHIECKTDRRLTGTVRYTSVNVHRGIEPSRRDDLESLIYVLVYLMRGKLPWQGVEASSKERKYVRIGEIKTTTEPEQLCHGLPHDVFVLHRYVRGILFSAKPDYKYMHGVLQDYLDRENLGDGIPKEWFAV